MFSCVFMCVGRHLALQLPVKLHQCGYDAKMNSMPLTEHFTLRKPQDFQFPLYCMQLLHFVLYIYMLTLPIQVVLFALTQ